jgi:hypothetical protein
MVADFPHNSMDAIKLAPALSMVYIRKVDEQLNYEIQVLPVTKRSGLSDDGRDVMPLIPYHIRRTEKDFRLFHDIMLSNLRREFDVQFGAIWHPKLGKIGELPEYPCEDTDDTVEFTTFVSNAQKLNDYTRKVLLLPSEIYRRAPIAEFFGRWAKDAEIVPHLRPDSEILNRRKEAREAEQNNSHLILSSQTELEKLEDYSQFWSLERKHNADKNTELPLSLLNKDLPPTRESIKPTFEEFVNDLAKSLGVKISGDPKETLENIDRSTVMYERNIRDTLDTVRDTVIEKPILLPRNSPSSARNSSSRDTVIDNPKILKPLKVNTTDPIIQRSQSIGDRDTVIEPSFPKTNGVDSASKRDLSVESPAWSPLYSSSASSRIPSKHNSTDGLRRAVLEADERGLNYSSTSKLAKVLGDGKHRRMHSSSALDDKVKNIVIPSRKDSRNWVASASSIDKVLPDSGGSVGSKTREYSPLKALPYDDEVRSQSGTPQKTEVEDNWDAVKDMDAKDSGMLKISPLDIPLIIRMVLPQGTPLYSTITRDISFSTLLEQIALAVTKSPMSNLWKRLPPPSEHMIALKSVCYRDSNFQLTSIQTEKKWQECILDLHGKDKLTLFLTIHERQEN